MCFVIIGDHDRIGHGLSDDLAHVVRDGKDDLKSELLILMSAVTRNTHGKLNLHCFAPRGHLGISLRAPGSRVIGRFGPLFDLIRIEDDDSLLLVFLKQFFLIGLLLLLSRCALALSLYTARAYSDLTAIEWFLLFLL